jgi:hypothetical protein
MGQDVKSWVKELTEAGWKQLRLTVWQAPCGCIYRGPYRAWTVMLAMKSMSCPNPHSSVSESEL